MSDREFSTWRPPQRFIEQLAVQLFQIDVENLNQIANIIVDRVGLRNQPGDTRTYHNFSIRLRKTREIEILQDLSQPFFEALGEIGTNCDRVIWNRIRLP